MRDKRLDLLAKVLVNYSLDVKTHHKVLLGGDLLALPLLEALYEELIQVGSHVKININPQWEEIFYRYASSEQLKYTCPFALNEVTNVDKRIRIMAAQNTRSLSGVNSSKQSLVSKANQPILSKVLQRSAEGSLDWVLSLFPTHSFAQEADMGFHEFEEFVFSACNLNSADPIAYWKEVEKKQQLIVNYMKGKKELHFIAENGTNLRVNIENMVWKNSCGKRNFPDGEVFTGPNLNATDGGVNGIVKYSFPAIWQNTEVDGIELVFERGKVVRATAKKNQDFLLAMISQDEGASRLGEIAIGTNYNIKRYIKNILFDEKIGGTFHAALGMGYPETGNNNQSGLHWDMVCDLREGGTIAVDGEVISKDGRFVFPDWPQP